MHDHDMNDFFEFHAHPANNYAGWLLGLRKDSANTVFPTQGAIQKVALVFYSASQDMSSSIHNSDTFHSITTRQNIHGSKRLKLIDLLFFLQGNERENWGSRNTGVRVQGGFAFSFSLEDTISDVLRSGNDATCAHIRRLSNLVVIDTSRRGSAPHLLLTTAIR